MTDKNTLVEMLRRNRLFDELTTQDVATIIDLSKEIEHEPGQVIVIEGATASGSISSSRVQPT